MILTIKQIAEALPHRTSAHISNPGWKVKNSTSFDFSLESFLDCCKIMERIKQLEIFQQSDSDSLYEIGRPLAALYLSMEQQLHHQSRLFGCDAKLTTTNDTRTPIVAYFANSPYSAYSNMTYVQTQNSKMGPIKRGLDQQLQSVYAG